MSDPKPAACGWTEPDLGYTCTREPGHTEAHADDQGRVFSHTFAFSMYQPGSAHGDHERTD
jgi:hypothetical protein